MSKLKVVTKKDNLSIVFGEWLDKTYGNTYYDAVVYIAGERFEVPYQYGYNAGDAQSIVEALQAIGYRLRNQKKDKYAPLRNVRTSVVSKLKRELFK